MKKLIKNKKLIIILILLILTGFVLIISLDQKNVTKQPKQKDTTDTTVSNTYQTTTDGTTRTMEKPKKAEVPEKVTEVIYEEAEKIPKSNDYIIEEDQSYSIDYFDDYGGFLIVIKDSPFEEKKELAEKAFLENLEITEEEACKLKVEITTPMYANPDEAGRVYSFSFCE
ncbi:hypothetical protein JXA63_04125 [Candidatus Woesebacteria bacterium]|nr:hypothetical protein [Candidatus Woesebacteria bacterium]